MHDQGRRPPGDRRRSGGATSRPTEPAWGCLDFGRGKWPYRTTWNWGPAPAVVGGRTVGLQLGGKWTDGTGMTENALVVDGRLSKLSEELTWDYDQSRLAARRGGSARRRRTGSTSPSPRSTTRSAACQAGSPPAPSTSASAPGPAGSSPDDGVPIEVDGLFGWAEEATWRW